MKTQNYRNPGYMSVVQGKAERNPNNFSGYGNANPNRFSNYAGDMGAGGFGNVNPLNNTITYVITNASNATGTFVLFGSDQYGTAVTGTPQSGQSAFVTVTVQESSAAQVARDTEKSPVFIAGCMIRTTNEDQFSEILSINWRSSSGMSQSYTFSYLKLDNPMNQNNKLLVADPSQFSLNVSGMTSITGNIIAGCTLTIQFYIGARTNQAEVFNNNPIVSLASGPFNYGVNRTVLQAPGTNAAASTIPLAQSAGLAK